MNSFLPRQGFLKFSCHSTPNYLESPICSKPKWAVCDTWEKWSFSESCFIGIVPRWSDFSQTWNRWHYPNTGNLRKRLKASDNLDDFYCWWSESTQDDHHQDDQWWSTQDDQDDHQWPHQDRLRQDYGREGFYAFTDAIDFTQYKVTHTLELNRSSVQITRITYIKLHQMWNCNKLVFSFRAVVSSPHLITVTPGQQGIWIVFSD